MVSADLCYPCDFKYQGMIGKRDKGKQTNIQTKTLQGRKLKGYSCKIRALKRLLKQRIREKHAIQESKVIQVCPWVKEKIYLSLKIFNTKIII